MKIPYKVGDIILLSQPSSNKKDLVNYKSRIADMSKNSIAIEMPISENDGQIGYFPDGNELKVTYPNTDGSQFVFNSTVIAKVKERIPLMLITYPEVQSITRVQRRNFLRVPCHLDVTINPIVPDEFDPFETRTIDLSGGGMMFEGTNSINLKTNTAFRWILSVPTQSGKIVHPSGSGKIVRQIQPQENSSHFNYSVQFTNVIERDRELIIKYCFDRQLEIKRKIMED